MTFSSWVERAKEEKRRMASQTPEERRAEVLQAKYSRLWRSRIHKCKGQKNPGPTYLFCSVPCFCLGRCQIRSTYLCCSELGGMAMFF